jgi:uncharacterized protein
MEQIPSAPKRYLVTPQLLYKDSSKLAMKIDSSNFRPTFMIAIWRGGCVPGMVVQSYLMRSSIEKIDHIAIRTASYDNGKQQKEVKVFNLGYAVERLNAEDNLLIVDDIFDSGRTIEAVLNALKAKLRNNMPQNVKIAVVYHKVPNNKTHLKPDFVAKELGTEWVILPHEIDEMTTEELTICYGW